MNWNDWGHMGNMGWMWIVWIGVIVGIILLVRGLVTSSPGGIGERETPEQVLKRRYAKGEIEKQEYEQKLEDLRR